MRKRVGLSAPGIILLGQVAAWAAETPAAVSPGRADTGAVVESRCPTFSWGEVEAARRYELVVYRLGEGGEEALPVLRESFTGSVYSWTPAMDRCLARGGRYAWSVRAVGKKGASEWSIPSLFEVAAKPSAAEVEAALALLRVHLEQRRLGQPERFAEAEAAAASRSTSSPRTAGDASEPTPRSHQGSGGGIIVDGVAVETREDPPCYPSVNDPERDYRFHDCGNGTVLDTHRQLIWAKNANCSRRVTPLPTDGKKDWWAANAFAVNVRNGSCDFLSMDPPSTPIVDHSGSGDWRLPTIDEWDSIRMPSCSDPPKIVGKNGVGCHGDTDNAWAVFIQAGGYWSSTDLCPNACGGAWAVSTVDGFSLALGKEAELFLWLVREAR